MLPNYKATQVWMHNQSLIQQFAGRFSLTDRLANGEAFPQFRSILCTLFFFYFIIYLVISRDVHNYYDRENWLLHVSESVPYLLAESSRSRTDPCHQSTQHWYNVEFQNRRPTRFLYNTIDTPADPRKDTDPICVLISGPISVC